MFTIKQAKYKNKLCNSYILLNIYKQFFIYKKS